MTFFSRRIVRVLSSFVALFALSCGGDGPTGPDGDDDDGETPVGNFTLGVGTSAISIFPGGSYTVPVTINRGSVTSAISLSITGLPSGVSATPVTIASGSSVGSIVINASSSAVAGTVLITVHATATGATEQTTNVSFTIDSIVNGPSFVISASPINATVAAGASQTMAVSIVRTQGFAGAVTVSVEGLPTSVTAPSITIASGSTTGTLTFTASASATASSNNLIIRGKATGMTDRTTPATLAVTAATSTPGFTLATASSSATVAAGASQTLGVTIARTGGFTGSVTVSVEGLPTGVTAPSITIASGSTSGTVTFTAGSSATASSNNLTIRGTATGVADRTASVTLAVTASANNTPGFSLSIAPTSLSIVAGGTATYTVTITRTGGFTGAVNLTMIGAPVGVSAPLPNSENVFTNSSTWTVTAAANTTLGAGQLTMKGTGSGIATPVTVTVPITVTAGAAIGVSMASTSLTGWQAYDFAPVLVTITRPAGITTAVTLTVENLPAGITYTADQIAAGSTTGYIYLRASSQTAINSAHSLKVRAKTTGATDGTKDFTVGIKASKYTGEFFDVKFRTWSTDNVNGDRCEYDVVLKGTVTVDFPSMVQGTQATVTVSHTMTATPVVAKVNNTNCVGGAPTSTGSKSYTPSMGDFPGVGAFPVVSAATFAVGANTSYVIQPQTSVTVGGGMISGLQVIPTYGGTNPKVGTVTAPSPINNFYVNRVGQTP